MYSRQVAAAAAFALLLSACNQGQPNADQEASKKSIDQLVQVSQETAAAQKETAQSSKATTDAVKALADRVAALETAVKAGFASQKRGALYLALDVEAACENDAQCTNTARAVCNKINYPNAITAKFTPGVRPTLSAVVCYD